MKKKDKFREREAQKYEQPIPSREFILEHLGGRGSPATQKQLLKELKLTTPEDIEALRRRLQAMVRDGQLLKNRNGAYGPVGKMELISGRVIGHKDGFGFVTADTGGDDLFLNARQMRSVFHGDKVLARIGNLDYRGRPEGIIVEVLERNTLQTVGRLFNENGLMRVESVNQRIAQPILIPPSEVNDAKDGQMVVVAITQQPTWQNPPTGKIIEVLGDHMAPGMEIDVAIRSHDLPHEWPDDVLEEAGRFPVEVPEEAKKGRLDLRDLPFVTIDGEDAKDFDDAVYCEGSAKGWTLYVAIADVAAYVKPGSALDREAYNRGNSVYFPERVIPMLPEALSNGLCSLKPNVDRLTMVCEMQITGAGKISRFQFHQAVIHSKARLTYKNVHAMLEKGEPNLRQSYRHIFPHLENLYDLFKVLHKARKRRGSIDFDIPETKILFTEERKIDKIVQLIRNDAHRLIEECMLCANISAAKYLLKNDFPTLFRIHEGPTQDKLEDLKRFLGEHALKLPGASEPRPADYAQLMQQIAERPDARLIQLILLRSLSQAVYSPDNKGHFGLAFEAYAHFTSPIRRYPDLLVHRAIRQVLKGHTVDPDSMHNELTKLGEHCSTTERRADEATREVIDWLKCEYMLNKVGENFVGLISSVTGFGLFVELKDIYVEGLIHISTLPNDYYQFDPTKQALLGERTGKRFNLGDEINVRVARVDLDQRQIDFVYVDEDGEYKSRRSDSRKVKVKQVKQTHPKKKKPGRKKSR